MNKHSKLFHMSLKNVFFSVKSIGFSPKFNEFGYRSGGLLVDLDFLWPIFEKFRKRRKIPL